nr:hypothetical protein BaRGS_013576 [Batillaria attramentaria]
MQGLTRSVIVIVLTMSPAPSMRARLLAETLSAAAEGGRQTAVTPGKRLFCNGYGGCRSGKRSLYSNWLSKMNSVAAGGR